MKRPYKILILLILCVKLVYSQELVPPIQNFSPSQYQAASQNWDIEIDKDGIVYAANNQGLLVYDGLTWELFPLESKSIIRSVYPHEERIYTGSYKEFGFWEMDSRGCLIYNSLVPLMKDLKLQNDEFWEILDFNDAIYFRSIGAVYKYKNDAIIKIEDIISTSMVRYMDKLVLSKRRDGLVFIDSLGALHRLQGDQAIIKNKHIMDMVVHGDSLILGSRDGLFVYSDDNFSRFPDKELSDLLEQYELNHLSISGKDLVMGTIKNGIIHYNLESGKILIYNRTSGLQNNTVLGLKAWKDKLWLALDKGIDVIDLNAPINFYTDATGELGAVYDLALYDGNYYLASNTGVYTFINGELQQIENASDHAWNLEVIDNVLYANHNRGSYKIYNNEFVPIDTRTGSFSITELPENSKGLLISNYTGLSVYNKRDSVREIQNINFPVKEVVFENDKNLWAAHPYEGVYSIETDASYSSAKVKKIPAIEDKPNYNPEIHRINNQIGLYLNGKWYKYNPFSESFKEFEELKGFSGRKLVFHDDEDFIFLNEEEGSLLFTNLKENKLLISADDLQNRHVKSNENVVKENDSTFYVTLNDGFARINLSGIDLKKENEWISRPFIKEFSDEYGRHELASSPVIPFKNSSNIRVRAGLPYSEATGLKYELKGEQSISGKVENGVVYFRNLPHGNYELELSVVGPDIAQDYKETFQFSISPPWYLSNLMKALYILVVILVIFTIYRLNEQKLNKHQQQLEDKFEKEHNERLNRLEKERLMNEIDLKRKELANTTMMAAKKNEVLMEIQGELNKDKGKFSNQFRLKHIMNKINNAVKNKDEWKVFETNFNEVHEDFFKELLQKYPKLTSKDLKLCSYLKMNLSSKEIAPLMGISVRGVEVHRYRLRKKMKLDSNVNLTKFLIKHF